MYIRRFAALCQALFCRMPVGMMGTEDDICYTYSLLCA